MSDITKDAKKAKSATSTCCGCGGTAKKDEIPKPAPSTKKPAGNLPKR